MGREDQTAFCKGPSSALRKENRRAKSARQGETILSDSVKSHMRSGRPRRGGTAQMTSWHAIFRRKRLAGSGRVGVPPRVPASSNSTEAEDKTGTACLATTAPSHSDISTLLWATGKAASWWTGPALAGVLISTASPSRRVKARLLKHY